MDLSNWNEEVVHEEVSIKDLDSAVQKFVDARADYEAKKKISNEADAVCKEQKRILIELLKRSGRKNWELAGIGKAIITEKLTVPTPKSNEDKQALAKYMQDTYGKDLFWEKFSINSMSLNAWYKQEIENNPEINIPGLEMPVAMENITFRRIK